MAAKPIMAAVVDGDYRSRLRGPVRGGSERFHAIKDDGSFACGFDLPPGALVPAHSVSVGFRCRRNGCAQLFAAASGVKGPDHG